mmetsp:Transcript_17399/g.49077  ORF Transcript_17399/g.49077 Transcript_17399/m.49077 type:complete len:319 (+) Transcript_17399:684-1640(+)
MHGHRQHLLHERRHSRHRILSPFQECGREAIQHDVGIGLAAVGFCDESGDLLVQRRDVLLDVDVHLLAGTLQGLERGEDAVQRGLQRQRVNIGQQLLQDIQQIDDRIDVDEMGELGQAFQSRWQQLTLQFRLVRFQNAKVRQHDRLQRLRLASCQHDLVNARRSLLQFAFDLGQFLVASSFLLVGAGCQFGGNGFVDVDTQRQFGKRSQDGFAHRSLVLANELGHHAASLQRHIPLRVMLEDVADGIAARGAHLLRMPVIHLLHDHGDDVGSEVEMIRALHQFGCRQDGRGRHRRWLAATTGCLPHLLQQLKELLVMR